MEVKLSLIAKAQHAFLQLFEAEDDEHTDGRTVEARRRAYDHYVLQITNGDKDELYRKTCEAIEGGTWHTNDYSYKPICDRLRKLGFTIVEGK